jgi:hypothetical protein
MGMERSLEIKENLMGIQMEALTEMGSLEMVVMDRDMEPEMGLEMEAEMVLVVLN